MSWFDNLVAWPGGQGPAGATAPPSAPYQLTHLLAAGVSQERAAAFLDPLNAACRKFQITSPERAAYFLAQVAWESDDFKALEEYWGPTPAQLRYENRKDLGNDRPGAGGPGNGRRWCGHGLIQTTGYLNHLAVANYFTVPLDGVVEWLMTPNGAAASAALYWFTHGCNELADAGDFEGVTRKINGGINGLEGRQRILSKLAPLFGLA